MLAQKSAGAENQVIDFRPAWDHKYQPIQFFNITKIKQPTKGDDY